jgi:hypothetical protein
MTIQTVNELSTFEHVRQILIHEMELEEDHVNIFNQRWKIPPYEDMFIVLQCLPSKTLSNRSTVKYNPTTGDYEEILDMNNQEKIVISIFSRNMDALLRKEEAIMSLCSVYSQQLQEANSFHIARIAPVEDLTMLEGAAQLYRYDIPVTILSWQQRTKTVEYYNLIRTKVTANE